MMAVALVIISSTAVSANAGAATPVILVTVGTYQSDPISFRHPERLSRFLVRSFGDGSMHSLGFQTGWAKTTRVRPPIL